MIMIVDPQTPAKIISDGVFEQGPGPFLDTSAFWTSLGKVMWHLKLNGIPIDHDFLPK